MSQIDAQPHSCCRQKCGRVFDRAPIRRLPPQPDLLHDVLGLSRISEHAVSDAKQTPAHSVKSRKSVVGFTWVCFNGRKSGYFLIYSSHENEPGFSGWGMLNARPRLKSILEPYSDRNQQRRELHAGSTDFTGRDSADWD